MACSYQGYPEPLRNAWITYFNQTLEDRLNNPYRYTHVYPQVGSKSFFFHHFLSLLKIAPLPLAPKSLLRFRRKQISRKKRNSRRFSKLHPSFFLISSNFLFLTFQLGHSNFKFFKHDAPRPPFFATFTPIHSPPFPSKKCAHDIQSKRIKQRHSCNIYLP